LNDPGLTLMVVHLKVLGGHPVRLLVFHQLAAVGDRRAFVELDYTTMPLGPRSGGRDDFL
jgi:hypothetical protein